MNLSQAKRNFFKLNPNTYAYFCKNEKLGKYVCYTYGYSDSSEAAAIPSSMIAEIEASVKGKSEDPIFDVINYASNKAKSVDMVELLSNFYYNEVVENQTTYKTIAEVCSAFNKYAQQHKATKRDVSGTQVACYEVNPDGTLNQNRIFSMDLTIARSKSGANYCKIENTFTEDDYKGNGIHTYGIKFLEAVLAREHIYSLIGESQECDVYDSQSGATLEQHYQKLGFEVTTDENGTNFIGKAIDPDFYLEISEKDLEDERI